MNSLPANLINRAEAQERYPTKEELAQLSSFYPSASKRIRIIEILTDNREFIISKAGETLFQKLPNITSPGGNAYGEEKTATCLRDLDYYLRIITYGIISGDVRVIEEICLIGVKETYESLGTSLSAMAEGIRSLKDVADTFLSQEDASEANIYFDYVINCMLDVEGNVDTYKEAPIDNYNSRITEAAESDVDVFERMSNLVQILSDENVKLKHNIEEYSTELKEYKLWAKTFKVS